MKQDTAVVSIERFVRDLYDRFLRPRLVTLIRHPAVWFSTVLGLGVILRCLVYGQRRCLWIDECMLALNIVGRDWGGLWEPLDWNQGAPVGFLLLVKASVGLGGTSESVLRLIPWLASLIGLVMFALLARRLLPSWFAVAAIGLYAVSPNLVSYAAECKQYAIDATVTVSLLLLFERFRRSSSRLDLFVLAAAGSLAVWLSHPAVFVLAGIGLTLGLRSVQGKDWRWVSILILTCGVTWFLSFGLAYSLHLRHLTRNDYLLNYWQEHFLPSPGSGLVTWLWDHFVGWSAATVGKSGAMLGSLLLIAGAVSLSRKERDWLILVTAVVGAALAAAALRRYPLAGRMLLFLTPIAVLLMTWGIQELWHLCSPRGVVLPGALFAMVGLAALTETVREWRRPSRSEEIQPLMEIVQQEWRSGDKVLILHGAVPGFLWYTREVPFPPGVVVSQCGRFIGSPAAEEWRRLLEARRVWVLASHYRTEEEAVLRTLAESTARNDAEWRTAGAWLRRYVPIGDRHAVAEDGLHSSPPSRGQ